MGLQTTMTTALTGMTAAETMIDVAGNNVANANTVGFKESSVSFATQFLQTQSIGSAPTDSRGGTNPRQVGLGVKVAEISPDFTPGTIEISSNPLDLAIQGDGFFIVQGSQGEQLYTRNGQFKTNANNEIVTLTGQRVLGYSVNADFEIQPTGLVPLHIPLGAAAVAQATRNVTMVGNLKPEDGEVEATSEVIQSAVLGDGSFAAPTTTPDATAVSRAPVTGVTGLPDNSGGASPLGTGSYRYRFTYVDAAGNNETPASTVTPTIAAGDNGIDLAGITVPTLPYTTTRVYRDDGAGGSLFQLVGTTTTATFSDTTVDAPALPDLDEQGLETNTYYYYITYVDHLSTTNESRPSARFGPVVVDAVNASRVRLDNIPAPPADSDYTQTRIYRSLATDAESFHLVATVDPNGGETTYTDTTPSTTLSSNDPIDLDGPVIEPGTRLIDVRLRENGAYVQLFEPGELSFQGTRNDRDLEARTFTIETGTTVLELMTFMEQAMGIVEAGNPGEDFPDVGSYGAAINNGKLQFTSNKGVQNALSIEGSAFRLTPPTGPVQNVGLQFAQVEEAVGAGASADIFAYDSLGTQVRVNVTTVVESSDSTGARFRWIATSGDNHDPNSPSTIVGTGVILTDSGGNFVSASNDNVLVDRGDSPANSPLEFELDFSQVTGLNKKEDSKWAAGVQDGFAAGTLTSFIISDSGRIEGVFSNGSSRDLGQIRMARFANNGGLQQLGNNMFAAGVNSGLPVTGDPGEQGIGEISAGALELSNTDIGQNLIKLILASTQYRGGARVITTAQQLLDELLSLRR